MNNKEMLESLKSDIADAEGMWFEPISCFVVRKDNRNIRYQHRYDTSVSGAVNIVRIDGMVQTDMFCIDSGLTTIVSEARGDKNMITKQQLQIAASQAIANWDRELMAEGQFDVLQIIVDNPHYFADSDGNVDIPNGWDVWKYLEEVSISLA